MLLTVNNAMEYLSNVASVLEPEHQPLVNVIFLDPAFAVAPGGHTHHHNYLGGLALHTAEVVSNCLMLTGMTLERKLGDPNGDWTRTGWYTGCDAEALLVAALLHDYLKTLDYGYELETVTPNPIDVGCDYCGAKAGSPCGISRVELGSYLQEEQSASGHYHLSRVRKVDPDSATRADEQPQPVTQRIKPGGITKLPYLYTIGHVTGGAMLFHMNAMNLGLPFEFVMKVTHIMLAHHGRREWGSAVEPKTPEAWILHAADMLSAQPLPKP